jgi:adenine deaminase
MNASPRMTTAHTKRTDASILCVPLKMPRTPKSLKRPADSMHHELALMVEAGLTPMEAIVACTSRAAAVIGRDDFGAIRPGHRADLLVLAADPLRDIGNTGTIDTVIVRGAVVDRAASIRPRLRPAG